MTISTLKNAQLDSDSEDEDYVPPAITTNSDSDEETRPSKRVKPATPDLQQQPPPLPEDEETKKAKHRELWTKFLEDERYLPNPADQPKKLVKIQKKYRFAGEELTEVVEVPEDSPEAQKWPLWKLELSSDPNPLPSRSSPATPDSTTPTGAASSNIPSKAAPPKKRPGPRKPKTILGDLPSTQKAKKITTLEKSAMDWRAHVEGEGGSSGLKDELEANRRGGGYLEKVEFLRRVEERKEDVVEASKGGKRRR